MGCCVFCLLGSDKVLGMLSFGNWGTRESCGAKSTSTSNYHRCASSSSSSSRVAVTISLASRDLYHQPILPATTNPCPLFAAPQSKPCQENGDSHCAYRNAQRRKNKRGASRVAFLLQSFTTTQKIDRKQNVFVGWLRRSFFLGAAIKGVGEEVRAFNERALLMVQGPFRGFGTLR